MVDSPRKTESEAQAATNGLSLSALKAAEDQAAVQKHYDTAKKELRELLVRKKQADKDLAQLEAQIYKLEGAYLEESQQGGNIVRGFDGYLKGLMSNRKSNFSEADRLFSLSSVSYSETAVSEKDAFKGTNKKRRKTMDDLAGSSDEEGSVVQSSGTNKRARVSYAD